MSTPSFPMSAELSASEISPRVITLPDRTRRPSKPQEPLTPPLSPEYPLPTELLVSTPSPRIPRYPSITPYIQIRSILELYWEIFNFVLDYEMRPCVYHVDATPVGSNGPRIFTEVPIRSMDERLTWDIGLYSHPFCLTSYHRLASSKHNHCDFSIQLFFPYLEPALKQYGATVTWLAVEVRPRCIFHLEGEKPDPYVRHSVFCITAQCGEEYIADFTVEQFGFAWDCWLMRKRDYENECTTRRKRQQPSVKEVEAARRGEFVDWNGKGWVGKQVCERINVNAWVFMDERWKYLVLEDLVKEASWLRWGWHPAYQSCRY